MASDLDPVTASTLRAARNVDLSTVERVRRNRGSDADDDHVAWRRVLQPTATDSRAVICERHRKVTI